MQTPAGGDASHHSPRQGVVRIPRLMCDVSSDDNLLGLASLVDVGVDAFRVCDENLNARELCNLTQRVMAASGVVVIVRGRLDVALAVGADGVQLGADDMSIEYARRLAPGLLIGAACHDRDDVRQARDAGADFASIGHSSEICLASLGQFVGDLPVLACGDLSAGAPRDVAATGVHGIAVVTPLWSVPHPLAGAAALARALAS